MLIVVLSSLGVVLTLAPSAAQGLTAGDPSAPVAAVRLPGVMREGPHGAILGSVKARCASGYALQEIVVEVHQGDLVSTHAITSGLTCDDAWHRVGFITDEGFAPGRAQANARMTVIDEVHGDPAPQAVDDRAIWVRAAAALRLPRHARLRSGDVVLKTRYRCDEPWLQSETVVFVSQGQASAAASVPAQSLACDDAWHRLRLRATPSGEPFHRGRALLDGYFQVADPYSFDPVAQAHATRRVRLH